MRTVPDHIVIACGSLEQGSAWLRAKLGVDPEEGGKHTTMGTHNRLLRLGPRQYLELLAVDPEADPPVHPRWLGLDERSVRERAAREPFLLTWVASTDDLDEAIARVPELGTIQEFSRGAFRWRMALPEGGSLAFDGVMPMLIQWREGHPCDRLEDRGCELTFLEPRHPSARRRHIIRRRALRRAAARPAKPGSQSLRSNTGERTRRPQPRPSRPPGSPGRELP